MPISNEFHPKPFLHFEDQWWMFYHLHGTLEQLNRGPNSTEYAVRWESESQLFFDEFMTRGGRDFLSDFSVGDQVQGIFGKRTQASAGTRLLFNTHTHFELFPDLWDSWVTLADRGKLKVTLQHTFRFFLNLNYTAFRWWMPTLSDDESRRRSIHSATKNTTRANWAGWFLFRFFEPPRSWLTPTVI